MVFLSVPKLVPRLNFKVNILGVRSWVLQDQTPLQLNRERKGWGAIIRGGWLIKGWLLFEENYTVNVKLQSRQVKCTPQDCVNEFIIPKLNAWVVVDFRFISAFLHEWWAMNSHAWKLLNFLKAILTIQKFSIWPDTEKFSENIYCSLRMQEGQFEFDTSYRNN